MKVIPIKQISSWSHSKLGDFDKCKFMTWLKHGERIPEPERPLPPGKTEHANDRGSRVHDNCENYVKGAINELCPEAEKYFGPQLDLLRVLHAEGRVSLEGEWGMNQRWEPTAWNGVWEEIDPHTAKTIKPTAKARALPERGREGDILQVGKKLWLWVPTWLRLKLDALVFLDETQAICIDYKTGRKFGNEMKHAEQLQLYQVVTFLRYPKLEKITVELWYIDQDEVTSQTYTRQQGLRFRTGFDRRGVKLTTTTEWPANPNIHSCKYCLYGPFEGATGHCQVGVREQKKGK